MPKEPVTANQQRVLIMLDIAIGEAKKCGLLNRIAQTCIGHRSLDDVLKAIDHLLNGGL